MLALPMPTLLALAALVVTAAIYDYRFRRIPNWLNLCGVIVGLGLNTYYAHLQGAAHSIEGLLLATAVYLPFHLIRGMGAGDVKLMAAIGSLLGPADWLLVFIGTALVGGVASVIVLVLKRRFAETSVNLIFLVKDLLHFRAPYKTNPDLDFRNRASLRLPHGVVIAIGCAAALAWSIGFDFSRLGSF